MSTEPHHGSLNDERQGSGTSTPYVPGATSADSTASTEVDKGPGGMGHNSDMEKLDQGPDSALVDSTVPPSKTGMSTIHEIAFVALITSAQLLTQAGFAQVIAPLHIQGSSFGNPNNGQLSWFAAAYSLTAGTFILIAGRLGDMFGHRKIFITGYFWYCLWSVIAGVAVYSKSQEFFDFCRAMQGIGPALLLPNALAIFGLTYPPGLKKNLIFALFGATAPGGFVVGAAFSGLLAERAWWPWAYWIMAIVCCLCAVLGIFLIPKYPEDTSDDPDRMSFDWLGAITGVTGLVLFNVAWNQGPVAGWGDAYVPVLLVLGLLFLVAFFFVEKRAKKPLLPLEGLSGDAAFVLGCIALGWSSFGIWVFYVWQFLEELRHISPLLAAAQISPAAISGLVAAITTGLALTHLKTAYVMIIAMTAFCVGVILVATMPIRQTYWAQLFVATLVTCWGMDMSFPAATILLSNLVPSRNQGIAASLVITVVNYSISIGLGIAGTVEVHVNRGGNNVADVLRGYRGALYAGIGTSGLGIVLAIVFALDGLRKGKLTKVEG